MIFSWNDNKWRQLCLKYLTWRHIRYFPLTSSFSATNNGKKYKNSCLSLSKNKLHENRLNGLKNLKDKGEVYKVDCAGDTASTSNDGWSTDEQPWMEGRRIIELTVVLSSLKACSNCGENISLLNIEDETRMGLCSIFMLGVNFA